MAGLRVLVAASEVVGFAKTGGLADVAGALPAALARRGNTASVVMPFYNAVKRSGHPIERTGIVLPVPMGDRVLACRVYRSFLPNTSVPVFLIEHAPYFERDDPKTGRGLYQEQGWGGKQDYGDNGVRFVFFCRAVMELVPHIGFAPDVIHANDWQTGLIPAYLAETYRNNPGYQRIRSTFTVHNIAYQGSYPRELMNYTGLPGWLYNPNQLEHYGFNFLKSGIVFADAVNTVSPTYAREIQTGEFGYGLEGLLTNLHWKLSGIVNGCDYEHWNPAHDKHIAARYTPENVFENKPLCKADLQRRFNLPEEPTTPVLGMVARLVGQKGIDITLSAAQGFLDLGCQIVVLGDGDQIYHDQLQALRDKNPNRVGIYLGFNETLAHVVEAGSDLFLMPSRYEPCGLNQMYSLKYGTPPVVRATGGLADTVVNATEENLADQRATGFSFNEYTAHALYETVRWALVLYRQRPDDFRQVVRTAMAQDWSWDRSAEAYERLYRKISGIG
ncbi:glycogen synthase GlgA [Gemmata sp. JC717]|uniref:glycogen synthase GlgA n=1 Tax=Gemmata algarum TaxID=2975278 RepID=UPI0021BACDDB|nr:glycogen synthase GlgA [Gemmata algarum]MDY3557075.1 glycogen synthase GlgA [Gemmata algarum]